MEGDTHQPGPSAGVERARLHPYPRPTSAAPSGTTAGGRLEDDTVSSGGLSAVRRVRIDSIRILPPQFVTLTDEQEVRAVVTLSELLMPLLRGRLLSPANSCEASSRDGQEAL